MYTTLLNLEVIEVSIEIIFNLHLRESYLCRLFLEAVVLHDSKYYYNGNKCARGEAVLVLRGPMCSIKGHGDMLFSFLTSTFLKP